MFCLFKLFCSLFHCAGKIINISLQNFTLDL